MNLKNIFIGCLFCIFFIGCDPLSDRYFEDLLNLKQIEISRICENNDLSSMGQGQSMEIYHMSEETLNKFNKRFENIENRYPLKNEFNKKYDIIWPWRKTPISLYDSKEIDFKTVIVNNTQKCFTNYKLDSLLQGKHNYYTAYYDKGLDNCVFSL